MATLKQLLCSGRYILFILVVALIVLLLSIVLPQYQTLLFIVGSDVYSLRDKMFILLSSLGAFRTLMTIPSQIFAVLIALLAGINVSLGIFYMKRVVSLQRMVGTNFIGILSGIVGIGCASCGSILLTSFLGTAIATGFLKWFPLQGLEFGFLGVVVLFLSILFTLKKIEKPSVCAVLTHD